MIPLPLRRAILASATLAAFAATATTAFAGRQGRVPLDTMVTPLYTVEGDAFIRHNGAHYSNRSLYCSHIYAAAFGGDKPVLRARHRRPHSR